jgi:hypothetical protein
MTLEANVELTVVAWAENNGWLPRKMQYIGRRGCPDHYFHGYGKIVPIEFKQPNGSLSPNQRREHRRLEEVGVKVHVFDCAEDAIDLLKGMMR